MRLSFLRDKNKQVESLREELKELNQASLKQVRDAGFRGDEALMQEKVISLNLKEKISSLEKMLETRQQELTREQQSTKPLRQEIERQRRMIERLITFEQLQTYKESEA